MRCIIVEDEPLALERLRDYVERLPLLELVATFDNATEALSFLLIQPVDLVLLDISLGGMSGIELLETAAISGQVVLTTAHPDHALKAFDLKVADYLLKPFSFARFVQGIERAQSRHTSTPPLVEHSYLFVKVEFRLEKVRIADILYIAGDSDYRKIYTVTGQLSTLQTLRDFEQRLPQNLVCRVHKSYMVSLDKIESIERDRIKIRSAMIPISATYRDRFYRSIGYAEQ